MQASEQSRSKERPSGIVILVAVAAVGSCGLVALPIGVYAFRYHVTQKGVVEARETTRTLATGIAECASQSASRPGGRLPATALPVPLALASVSGRRYQSRAADWQDEAYRCARFSLDAPQPAQLQWIRTSDTAGYVRAALDVDGDMKPEWTLEQPVQCSPDGRCALGEMSDRR